jgi:hypothetical protein
MTPARALLILTLGTFVPDSPAAAAVALLDDVTVRVYETAGIEGRIREAALAVAAETVAVGSVHVHWQHCESATPARCATPVSKQELVVRIVRSAVSAWSRGTMPLGDAFIDSRTRTGVLATVYADRVLFLAHATGTDPATLLGHAIAHELGHLLLATNAHSPRGLMRASWSPEDLRRGRGADWTFTAPEIAALRVRAESARLDARGTW